MTLRLTFKLEDKMKKKFCLLQLLRYTAFFKQTSGNRYKSLNSFFAMQKHSKSGPVPSLTAQGQNFYHTAITKIWQGFQESHSSGKHSSSRKPRLR